MQDKKVVNFRRTDDILPYKKNTRIHNEEQIKKLSESIDQFGLVGEIVIRNGIIAKGHATLQAVQKLYSEDKLVYPAPGKSRNAEPFPKCMVPVLDVSAWTEDQFKAYVITDNRIGEMSSWGIDNLISEIGEINLPDFNVGEMFDFESFVKEKIQSVKIDTLKQHPKNYKQHPQDQIDHICNSIKQNGVYKNIIVAKDYTILAGHGVYIACKKLEHKKISVLKLDIDANSTQALKLLATDNEVANLSDIDDRALSEILKEILSVNDLLGTGFNESMLANLIFNTRHTSEIKTKNEAEQYVGMPTYQALELPQRIVVSFETDADRIAFGELVGAKLTKKTKSIWFPFKENDDMRSVIFTDE